ncbi:MAG: SH3 domain-containing protein [Betaproteobacteria bacterium]|nr:SH3 domain-containing protein [Betaproteobacteria bacterium]MDH4326742.1 SH3 domain-containing protein [Betaproteobacteria bacterium]MDH5211495.1 SH3 domain-containing protein [Betaproteobacteria bacterium]
MKRFAAILLFVPALGFAEPATLVRDADLRASPASDAAVVAPLAVNAKVEALERRGGWTRVRAEGGTEGWVRMLVLRYAGTGEAKQGDSGIVQLLNVARTGTSGTQVTTGVRGLDPEQLKNARPNAAELKRMQGYRASPDAAAAFAGHGRLEPKKVAYPKEGG